MHVPVFRGQGEGGKSTEAGVRRRHFPRGGLTRLFRRGDADDAVAGRSNGLAGDEKIVAEGKKIIDNEMRWR